ncbi:MAG: hypothetical protein H6Q26_2356 [Bacteroidetes bacterium]|uniref:hypothetical protein n=1 Tax=unclassified Chitinophaga TaxID=2619133 RepID=UPI0009CF40E3|nr:MULTISPECIES: hypothetical protein [unclassified Chitinophaga]MBP1652199.1 hypothetical protein [Bacteroidota bacterium]OMP77541.1 hypothetical protein BW716_19280 [[Flexibacter] sp. ATCC 35208]WPV65287.1 hypothetical protein QQL36_26125 [Chitinophaga sp. LS1]
MFEQLSSLIQQHSQQSVADNPAIPNEHNQGVVEELKNVILSKVTGLVTSGQTDKISEMLSSNGDTPETKDMENNFATNIMQKFGINSQVATTIAATLIPGILNALRGQGGIQEILASLGGGGSLSGLSSLGAKFGLDKDNDGDVDLNDLGKMFKF